MKYWLNKENWFVDWVDMRYGIWSYICRTTALNLPLGFVYGMPLGKRFMIMGIYVPKWTRREGIARFMMDYISNQFPTLITQSGSDEGGEAFIKAYGFTHDEKSDWTYQRKEVIRMKTVEFKFDLDQKVRTSLGMEGIVSMLGFDRGGNHYFVKGASNSDWYPEDQLTAVE